MFLISKENKHLTFFADTEMFIMGILYFFSCSVLCGIGIYITKNDFSCCIFFIILEILHVFSCLFTLPKWVILINLYDDRIVYKAAYKKRIETRYTDFGYFYCASYTHYTTKKYIVFSKRRLSDYELTHINNVPVSDKLIKIRVRKGLKETLSSFLPPKYLLRIPKDFW